MSDAIDDRDWELARVLLAARERLSWGSGYPNGHTKWPERKGYTHNPIAAVDLALAEAKAAREYFECK